MLTCKELTELVTDYLEGRMPFMQRVSFQLHLGMCGRCRAYLRQMKMTVKMLGRLPDEPIPPGVRDELLVRFRSMRPAGPAIAVQRHKLLASLDGWLGRSRGWLVVGVLFGLAALMKLLTKGHPGPVLGELGQCLFVELGAAALPIVVVGFVVIRAREAISASSLAALAASGAFLGYLSIPLTCSYCHVTAHVLVVHVASIPLAALLGAAASHVPALASP